MMFWITAAVLTFLATLSILLPLTRARPEGDDRGIEYDKAIYRARVDEIEKDLELGRIQEDAAKLAIAEEGRRLIAVSGESGAGGELPVASRNRTLLAVVALVAIPAAALAIYLSIGSPGVPDQTLASRLEQAPEDQSVDELIARAEGHLSKNPDDARGWAVLAPVYSRVGRTQDAVRAWANVLRLAPDTPEIRATLAENMVAMAEGVITEDARRLFQEELAINTASAKARFYLALALGQEGKHGESVRAWDILIDGGNRQAPWLEAALDYRNRSAEDAGVDKRSLNEPGAGEGAQQPGPTREDVEAASQMSQEERMAMISQMVADLAGKLKNNPADKEGWLRLIQSYAVLGDFDKAEAAINSAAAGNGDDEAFMQALAGLRSQLPTTQSGNTEQSQ